MFRRSAGRRLVLGLLTTAVGVAVLVVLIRRVGWQEVVEALAQIRWGFVPILALAGARLLIRAFAWTRCVERSSRLPLRTAFAATMSGDALGNLTPLGPFVGEPAKAALVRDRVPLVAALSALALENLCYVLSVVIVIALGLMALLYAFDLPAALRQAGLAALGAIFILLAVLPWLVWRRPRAVAGVVDRLARDRPRLSRQVERLRAVEGRLVLVYEQSRARLASVLAAETLFHVLGVAEIYVVLWLMSGSPPALLSAFILETQNRLFTVLFKIVPLRIGVDEAGAGFLANLLGLGTASGVALALVRKIRILFWSVTGALLLVRRGLTAWRVVDERGRGGAPD
jgi:hypothetical protein